MYVAIFASHLFPCNPYSLPFLLNQACGQRPARAWFLEIAFVREVGMRVCSFVCMCVRPRLLETIYVKLSLNRQLNKSYCFSVSLYGTCYRYY